MKKVIISCLLVLSLSGCFGEKELDIGIAKPIQVPDAPEYLMKKAERLPDITDPSFGGIMVDGAETDSKYNDVANRYNLLIDFYKCMQVSVNEKKDIKECLK